MDENLRACSPWLVLLEQLKRLQVAFAALVLVLVGFKKKGGLSAGPEVCVWLQTSFVPLLCVLLLVKSILSTDSCFLIRAKEKCL